MCRSAASEVRVGGRFELRVLARRPGEMLLHLGVPRPESWVEGAPDEPVASDHRPVLMVLVVEAHNPGEAAR